MNNLKRKYSKYFIVINIILFCFIFMFIPFLLTLFNVWHFANINSETMLTYLGSMSIALGTLTLGMITYKLNKDRIDYEDMLRLKSEVELDSSRMVNISKINDDLTVIIPIKFNDNGVNTTVEINSMDLNCMMYCDLYLKSTCNSYKVTLEKNNGYIINILYRGKENNEFYNGLLYYSERYNSDNNSLEESEIGLRRFILHMELSLIKENVITQCKIDSHIYYNDANGLITKTSSLRFKIKESLTKDIKTYKK